LGKIGVEVNFQTDDLPAVEFVTLAMQVYDMLFSQYFDDGFD
jgi:hypothetical protein